MVDKTALVTGASRGIGLAVARALAVDGYALTVVGRDADGLQRVFSSIKDEVGPIRAVRADLSKEEDIVALVAEHRAAYGRIDLLVNNAGIGIRGDIDDYETKWIDLQYRVNLRAVTLLYREAMDLLLAGARFSGSATVVNMSSVVAKGGREALSVYSAMKAGVVALTEAMNRELSLKGIRSCAVCPAFVNTDLSSYMHETLPPQEMIPVDDITETVRYLTRISAKCIIPEIVMLQPGPKMW